MRSSSGAPASRRRGGRLAGARNGAAGGDYAPRVPTVVKPWLRSTRESSAQAASPLPLRTRRRSRHLRASDCGRAVCVPSPPPRPAGRACRTPGFSLPWRAGSGCPRTARRSASCDSRAVVVKLRRSSDTRSSCHDASLGLRADWVSLPSESWMATATEPTSRTDRTRCGPGLEVTRPAFGGAPARICGPFSFRDREQSVATMASCHAPRRP